MRSNSSTKLLCLFSIATISVAVARKRDKSIDYSSSSSDDDQDLDQFQKQLTTIFYTICTGIGTVLACILGFYGWTFWTSIKCYYESKNVKKQQNAASNSSKSSNTDEREKSDKHSFAPINRCVRVKGPYRLQGTVVTGFGRGSRELGWPTANLDPDSFKDKVEDSEEGVYIAWAQVVRKNGFITPVYKSLVSIGWNPAYGNTGKSVEAYICSNFDENFYGAELRLVVVAYLRPQVRNLFICLHFSIRFDF